MKQAIRTTEGVVVLIGELSSSHQCHLTSTETLGLPLPFFVEVH